MKTRKKLLTGTLLAICTALLVLCSVLAIGWSKAAKTGDALPEVRNNGTAIQWKYSDEADWHDLVALTELRGAAGENGKNGTDGKDGSNGADGKNGINGTNGKDGINGVDGKDGANGKDGINGTNGINAKSIEVQRAETHIQWRYEGDEWQDLVAIADITGPTGQKGADGANGKTPEFRVSENTCSGAMSAIKYG
jgi:collagen triple helix repeat protein